jgi:hypothetical protein
MVTVSRPLQPIRRWISLMLGLPWWSVSVPLARITRYLPRWDHYDSNLKTGLSDGEKTDLIAYLMTL